MITKEQLQAMSDFEVNSTLADFINVKWQISAVDDECLMVGAEVLDYCNTPNDIMPLAFEHGISVIKADNNNLWLAMSAADGESVFRQSEIMVQDESPLRAIACCLILVLQGLNA